jgi:shikimate kinase
MVSRVYLIGFMGSGKSTIGRYIASDLGWEQVDLDREFEAEHNSTISQFFESHGEAAFREEETKLLERYSNVENVVISTGGGLPCFGRNIEIMKSSGLVIYIQVEPEILMKRLGSARDVRPLVSGKSGAELLDYISLKLKEREPFYRQANIIVDGEALPFSFYKTLITHFPVD